MPQQNSSVSELLRKLEKSAAKVIRKSLKNNTLDYTIQFTISSLEPGKVKYACMITSPAQGVQPIIFSVDTYKDLESALKEAETELNPRRVEIAFHESRINTYETKVQAHKERLVILNDPDYKEETEDDVPMEEV